MVVLVSVVVAEAEATAAVAVIVPAATLESAVAKWCLSKTLAYTLFPCIPANLDVWRAYCLLYIFRC